MSDNINTFTLIFYEGISYFVEYPEERYIRRACFAFAFIDISIPVANDVEATINDEELERHAEFHVVFADIPQRSVIDTETLISGNHHVRYASTTNMFLFNRTTHIIASADSAFSDEPITRNSSFSGRSPSIANREQPTLHTRSMTVFPEIASLRIIASADTVFTEALIARNLEFNSVFASLTVDDTGHTEVVTHEEQQTLYAAVSTVSPDITSLQEITNVETVYVEEELLRNSGFISVFIYAPLQYAANDEEQQNVHRNHIMTASPDTTVPHVVPTTL